MFWPRQPAAIGLETVHILTGAMFLKRRYITIGSNITGLGKILLDNICILECRDNVFAITIFIRIKINIFLDISGMSFIMFVQSAYNPRAINHLLPKSKPRVEYRDGSIEMDRVISRPVIKSKAVYFICRCQLSIATKFIVWHTTPHNFWTNSVYRE